MQRKNSKKRNFSKNLCFVLGSFEKLYKKRIFSLNFICFVLTFTCFLYTIVHIDYKGFFVLIFYKEETK